MSSRASFSKRHKEQLRKQKQQEKAERKQQRKAEKQSAPLGIAPDIEESEAADGATSIEGLAEEDPSEEAMHGE